MQLKIYFQDTLQDVFHQTATELSTFPLVVILVLQDYVASKLFCHWSRQKTYIKISPSSGQSFFGKGSTNSLIQALAPRGREGQSHLNTDK